MYLYDNSQGYTWLLITGYELRATCRGFSAKKDTLPILVHGKELTPMKVLQTPDSQFEGLADWPYPPIYTMIDATSASRRREFASASY